MAAGLSDAQIEEFREAFHLFDKNQDGTITTKDLGNVLKAIGQNPSDEETQQLMERVRSNWTETWIRVLNWCCFQFDTDGTGSIDFPEFLALIAKIQKDALDDRDEVKDAICAFDKEGLGYLKRDQVEKIIREIGEPMTDVEMNQMLDSMVYSSDGRIDIDAFVDIIFNV